MPHRPRAPRAPRKGRQGRRPGRRIPRGQCATRSSLDELYECQLAKLEKLQSPEQDLVVRGVESGRNDANANFPAPRARKEGRLSARALRAGCSPERQSLSSALETDNDRGGEKGCASAVDGSVSEHISRRRAIADSWSQGRAFAGRSVRRSRRMQRSPSGWRRRDPRVSSATRPLERQRSTSTSNRASPPSRTRSSSPRRLPSGGKGWPARSPPPRVSHPGASVLPPPRPPRQMSLAAAASLGRSRRPSPRLPARHFLPPLSTTPFTRAYALRLPRAGPRAIH